MEITQILNEINARADESGTPGRAAAIRQAVAYAQATLASPRPNRKAARRELGDRACLTNAALGSFDLARLINQAIEAI